MAHLIFDHEGNEIPYDPHRVIRVALIIRDIPKLDTMQSMHEFVTGNTEQLDAKAIADYELYHGEPPHFDTTDYGATYDLRREEFQDPWSCKFEVIIHPPKIRK